jgi:hypothetical protein
MRGEAMRNAPHADGQARSPGPELSDGQRTCWSWRSSSIFRQEVGELQGSAAGLVLQAHHPD